ncbi:MAG TPA: ABC transporter substrate-binding protein [Syntrophorhabdaceae bacterium]|nr:ABC transporter substrate-binding protein [Syntrophorhabdaceae bacterium]
MGNRRMLLWTSAMYLIFICAIGSFAVSAANAASPNTITKKIVVALINEPDTLDLTATKSAMQSRPVAENVVEHLVSLSPDGKFIPGLATSWEISQDGKEYDFFLRKGVKFHSGDLFTAKDVQFSHERSLKYHIAYQRDMRNLDTLVVVDDYHVKLKLKVPDALIISTRFVPIGSKAYFDRVGEERFARDVVGTGPYQFVKWELGQYIDLKANDNYWGNKPAVKLARFVFIKEDSTRVSMLKAGEADMIVECPFSQVKQLESAGYRTSRRAGPPSTSIQFHTYNPKVPWLDKTVRLAIAMAIDSESMVNNLFQGIPTRPVRLSSWELGYDKDLKHYPYNPAMAKKLLAEAGYPNGFDMPLYYSIGRASGQKETTELVAHSLSAIGIRPKVEGLEIARMMEMAREWHKSADTVYAGISTLPTAECPDPVMGLETAFLSSSSVSLYKNPALDGLVEKARQTANEKKRADLIKQAFKIIHDDVPTAQLWSNVSVFAMQKKIVFTPTKRSNASLVLLKDILPAN